MNASTLKRSSKRYILTKLLPVILLWYMIMCCVLLAWQNVRVPPEDDFVDNVQRSNLFPTCTYETFIMTVARFIEFGGKYSLESMLPEECTRVHPSRIITRRIAMNAFMNSFSELGKRCSHNNNTVKNRYPEGKSTSLTLFTTHDQDVKGKNFKNITLVNWSFIYASKILFSNKMKLEPGASSKNWYSLPITHQSKDGFPVLKTMFQVVGKMSISDFYVYANSDILFDQSLVETLNSIKQMFDITKPLVAIGRRTNVHHVTEEEAKNQNSIKKISILRGELFTTGAEDYIITTKDFPWTTVPDLVVGRISYDNWIVAHARCTLKLNVIDATETLLAVHHTTKAGIWESSQKPNHCFNNHLLKKLNLSLNFDAGLTNCAEWKTIKGLCGDIKIVKRKPLQPSCKCLH